MLEKQDDDTNISCVKLSISSKENNSKEAQTPPSPISEKWKNIFHKASHSTVDKCGTPERNYDSIQSAKVNISHSVQGENKTESVEVPESSQPQKLKLSGYIRDNLLNKYNQR